jgi:hypothetical protein
VRKIFKCQRGALTGGSRKLNAKERQNMYSLPNIVWVIRMRMMLQAGHMAVTVKNEMCTETVCGET